VGVVVEETNGNSKTTRIIQCGLNIVENTITLSIPENEIDFISTAISVENIIVNGSDIIQKSNKTKK
jgi:hypothetical protein